MDYKKVHGEILKFVLRNYTLDRTEFAEELGIAVPTLTQYVNGNRLPVMHNERALRSNLETKIQRNKNATINKVVVSFIIEKLPELAGTPSADSEPIKFISYALSYCHSRANGAPANVIREEYPSSGRIQIVVFDFDGTLAKNYTNKTTWETIWEKIGYSISECQELHKQYSRGDFSHQEWCDKTAERFIKKKFHYSTLSQLALNINLLEGVCETFETLYSKNIKIHVLSGSVIEIIRIVLNGLGKYVTDTKANEFKFDNNGYLEKIIGTHFDFDGKAEYVLSLSERYGMSTKDILFVGNSQNDQSVHVTGAKTLCINPRKVDPTDKNIWDDYIETCLSLKEIIPYLETLSSSYKAKDGVLV